MKIGIVTPLDPRTGISIYSAILAVELENLGEDVSIIRPENSSNLNVNNENIRLLSPENYEAENYDITHFQLANSNMHEFQLHLLDHHREKLKMNSNIITTVHDARNFDSFNLQCLECISFGIHLSETPFMYPFDIVDRGFQRISKYLIFHNRSALNEYKNRYKLNNKDSLKCIPISAYRFTDNNHHEAQREPQDNRILVPGYISPFKGQDILLKAVSRINHDLKLIFMGKIVDEQYGMYLDNLIEKEGLSDKVEFLGFVTDNEFIEEIDKAQIILVPRLISSWMREQPIFKIRKFFGLDYLINQSSSAVLTTALASGKPIICSKNQGFSEYVDSSRGILCDDGVESWSNAIQYLLENPDKLREMSLNSKTFANETLHPNMIAKRHIKLYKECLENK